MALINKKGLKQLIRASLSGQKMAGLTLLIKSGPDKEARLATLPELLEKRRNVIGGEHIVRSPERRIIQSISRSPDDHWTIIYKDKIVAQGAFLEVRQQLQAAFSEVVSYPSFLARQALFYGGIAGILGFFFLGGFVLNSFLAKKKDSGQDFVKLDQSLSSLKQRQDTISEVLDSVSAQIKEAMEKEVKEAAKPRLSAIEPKERMAFSDKLRQATESTDLSQLVSLQAKRKELLMQDEELENKGFMPLHNQRREIKKKIELLERQIYGLKKKYGLPADDPL